MGRLIGIARMVQKRAAPEVLEVAEIGLSDGIAGDVHGKSRRRQVTVLFREGWEAACAQLGAELPWTTRRANLLVEGVRVPPAGARLSIGPVVLQVQFETDPCDIMERAHPGLRKALTPEWRGGVCCSVLVAGRVHPGDPVMRLP